MRLFSEKFKVPFQRFPGTERRLYFFSLCFYAALLPFQVTWLPLTLGLMFFGFVWLFGGRALAGWNTWLKTPYWWPFALFYLWMALGLVWAPGDGSREMTLKLSLFFWPLAFSVYPNPTVADRNKLLSVFLYAGAASALYLLFRAFWAWWGDGNVQHFYYDDLGDYPMIPPHYLSMYFNLAMGWSLWRALNKGVAARWLNISLAVLFAVMVVLLAVRIQFIIFPLVVFAVLLAHFRKRGHRWRGFFWSAGMVVAFIGLIFLFPGSRGRAMETIDEYFSLRGKLENKQTNARVYIWSYSLEVIKENWLIGTGTGAEDAALGKKLETCEAVFWNGNTPYKLSDFPYNYHNVFLQHAAAHGIPGILFLLWIFIYPLRRRLTLEGGLFLLVCALSFLTESILQRQAGVLFFSFFYGLLVIFPLREEDKQHGKEDK